MTHEGRWLRLLVVGLAVALAFAIAVRSAAPSTRGPDREAAAAMLTMVNDERATHGRPPLRAADDLAAVAERWSATMADTGVLEHNPAQSEQICCWASIAENIAFAEPHGIWRPGDPVLRVTRELHEALLASPGHRENLLAADLDEVGIGVHVGADGSVWITQNFRLASH